MKTNWILFSALSFLFLLNILIGFNNYGIKNISISKFYFDQASQKHVGTKKIELKLLYRQNAEDHEELTIMREGRHKDTSLKSTKIIAVRYYEIN
jgi:hypothetical protein